MTPPLAPPPPEPELPLPEPPLPGPAMPTVGGRGRWPGARGTGTAMPTAGGRGIGVVTAAGVVVVAGVDPQD